MVTSVIAFLGYVSASIALEGDLLQQSITKREDVFLEADQMDYDQNRAVVTARGRVQVQKGTNTVFADQITYDQNANIVVAEGNVSYIAPDGNAVFTDRVVLRDDLKQGVINYFRARLDDGSLIAAAEARRVNDSRMELTKAVYSPCPTCAEHPEAEMQWQLKADKVIIDNAQQKVEYEDAYFEVYGVPVAYTPYFAHPTPNADRKSGILVPTFRTDSNLGGVLTLPYYFNVAPNMEATVRPTITTKEGLVLGGDWSHLTEYGQYDLTGSITRPRGFTELASSDEGDRSLRGHLKGKGIFDLTEHWDFGFDGQYTSDDTYLRRYDFDNTDLITSRAFFDRISERNFTRIQAVHFRGLLEQDSSTTTPIAAPYLRSHVESTYGLIPGFDKSKMTFDATSFNVVREIGDENFRGSIKSAVSVPFVTSGGHIFEASASLRADQYYLDGPAITKDSVNRVIPEVSFGWRLPMVSETHEGRMLLEPIVKIIATPNTNYNNDIPDEDSQDVEFSELNVFDDNRYRGIDRVENGIRMQYGLRGGYYGQDYHVDYVVGQNYRFREQKGAPVNSGIEDNVSDFVGRVSTNYKDIVDLSYRFRFEQDSLAARRHEVDMLVDYYPVKVGVSYFNLDYDFTNTNDNREEVTGMAKVNVTPEWSVIAGGTRNLAESRAIYAKAGLLYEGDCTDVEAVVRKDYISDRDAKSGTSFDVKVALKNLGEL